MPRVSTVRDLLGLRADNHPGMAALVVNGGPSLTYGAWQQRSDAAAAGLVARGVRAGDRVVLHFDNAEWLDYAVCYLGVHQAGAVAVPTSPRFAEAELARICDDTAARVVVADAAAAPDGPASVEPAELLAAGPGPPPAAPDRTGDALAEIVYTSGTTGSPKGVAIPHASIMGHDLPEAPEHPTVFAHAFPIGTNAAQACLRMPLRRPATAVVLPRFDADRLCAVVAERRVERLQLVPAMAEKLVASGAVGRHDVSSLRRIILSSAPTPPALWQDLAKAFPAAELWNTYALTESGSARTLLRDASGRPGSVGHPVGATELRVVDEDGRQLPAGETGEILLRRPGTPQRYYYRDPEATARAFRDGWLHTGDLGYLDDDGFLYLVDRRKDLIISGGVNISSVEVQNALHEHPAVREAAVLGVPHPVLGQAVAAAVVLGAPVSERELQSTVRAQLGEHKVPRRIDVVDRLPRNASGKVLKRELSEQLTSRPPGPEEAPRDDVEAAVMGVWVEVLGREDISVHDDFFDLGGESLAATQVVARLEDAFSVDLPPTLVFERPTVAELAAAISDLPAGVA